MFAPGNQNWLSTKLWIDDPIVHRLEDLARLAQMLQSPGRTLAWAAWVSPWKFLNSMQ
jgi:hypothetical protein